MLDAAQQMKYCSTIDDLEDKRNNGTWYDLKPDDPHYKALPPVLISFDHQEVDAKLWFCKLSQANL
jgi:hypothetical protein